MDYESQNIRRKGVCGHCGAWRSSSRFWRWIQSLNVWTVTPPSAKSPLRVRKLVIPLKFVPVRHWWTENPAWQTNLITPFGMSTPKSSNSSEQVVKRLKPDLDSAASHSIRSRWRDSEIIRGLPFVCSLPRGPERYHRPSQGAPRLSKYTDPGSPVWPRWSVSNDR